MHTFCFRFDIDTHKCLRDGVPNLIKLGEKHNVKFTFFLNTGKSVDLIKTLIKLFKQNTVTEKQFNLSALYKLGLRDYIYLTVFNPTIAHNYLNNVNLILNYKHELALHGGRNHQQWAELLSYWDVSKIENEVNWGLNEIYKIDSKYKVKGFASPAWNSSKKLEEVLNKKGFKYIADYHTDKPFQKINKTGKLNKIPTNILGEPGGVGYIEYCRAKGMNFEQILRDFQRKLHERNQLAVMYDHPYYAGIKEINILDEMIKIVKNMNYKICTFNEL